MASSTFTNAYLVDFESVLNIPDNEGMQNMFKELESSGLRGAISGKYFSISPSRFAGVFELPTEGISNFSDVPKNLVYDARKIFSKSGEPVVPHGKKKLLKYEYRLLNDILAKSITIPPIEKLTSSLLITAFSNRNADVIFADHRSSLLLNNLVNSDSSHGLHVRIDVHALTMGEATPFPSSKILSPKTVLTYITTNQIADTRGQSYEGGKTPMEIVKRASKSKKKSESTSDATVEIVSEVVGSKKRPAVEGSEPVVPKKVPLQVIEPTPAVIAAQPPAPKQKSCKRKLILSEGSDDDNIEENIDVASVKVSGVNIEEPNENVSHASDEVDVIIGQILIETYKLTTDDTESAEQMFTETDVGDIAFDFEESSSDGSTFYRSPSPLRDEPLALGPGILTVAQEEQLYLVQSPESPPATSPCLETSTSSTSLSMHFDADDITLDDTADIQTSLPVGRTEFVEAIDDLRAFILQHIDDSNSEIQSKLHTLERGLRDTLHDQDANAQKLIYSVCQDAHTMSDVQKLHLNEVKKVVLAQGVTAGADSLEIRKEFKALDPNINSLDGQVAAIRNEQLEFQTKIAADILSLSTQLDDIVDYIRGGDAKKGEGSSSRRPLPTPIHQIEGTCDAVRITELTQANIYNANRAILERMRNEDRERERRERSKGSRSGSYKIRRF
ncbi:hypothetical protein F511_23938 [Dorcoceras hygrometricum]|uniref:Uncharacterized protein n=1 Tax=Dorcoceras hygrometricum TaxID=472368 RepID=A0A2Z7BC59_9LAMI|nr:hypothetical protein F511_23938 [Dorcoceras hygrometricum]